MFPSLVSPYRKSEKLAVKIVHTKARIHFLKECLSEKVLPASMSWMKKLNYDEPFPIEAASQIRLRIRSLKIEVDHYYFKFRQIKRDVHSSFDDGRLWADFQRQIYDVQSYQRQKKDIELSAKLNNLIMHSPWTKFSNVDNVINLSSFPLSLEQKQILGYGLNFALPHTPKYLIDYVEELDKRENENNKAGYNFLLMNLSAIFRNLKRSQNDFLPRRFSLALNHLKQNKNISICKADKGGSIVVMDCSMYKLKMHSLLDDHLVYKKLKSDPLKNMQSNFNSRLKDIMNSYNCDFLKKFTSRLPSLPYMYGLPKVHKENVPFRPIISTCGSPAYYLSKWAAKQLSPLLGVFSDSHLKHNQDLLDFLKKVVPGDDKFISFDVSSLFTNVPLQPALEFLERKLLASSFEFDVPIECLIDLVKLCLNQSYFQFEDGFYEQIFGLSMGNPLSPVISCLFLEYLETEKLPLYKGIKPKFWKRYVDDVLCLVPPNFELESFLSFINSLHPTIKFTFEWENDNKIPFLDILIHRSKSFLKFSVYRKPTNGENYLHFFSFTDVQIKIGLAQSLFLRAFRVCDKEFLDNEIKHLGNTFEKLAYPKWLLDKAFFKAKKSYYRSLCGKSKNKNNNLSEEKKSLLVVPFTPVLKDLKGTLRNFDTDIVFSYKNKIGTSLSRNKPKSTISSGVYSIPCSDCPEIYIGETGRDLHKVRVKEHETDVKNNKIDSGVAQHSNKNSHTFNFDKAEIIYYCHKTRKRRVVESAVIKDYSDRGLSCNLNSGFSPQNVILSKHIREVLHI